MTKERKINEAGGDAARITPIAAECDKAAQVTGHRLYIGRPDHHPQGRPGAGREEVAMTKERKINEAGGDAARITPIAAEYDKAAQVTGHRLYSTRPDHHPQGRPGAGREEVAMTKECKINEAGGDAARITPIAAECDKAAQVTGHRLHIGIVDKDGNVDLTIIRKGDPAPAAKK